MWTALLVQRVCWEMESSSFEIECVDSFRQAEASLMIHARLTRMKANPFGKLLLGAWWHWLSRDPEARSVVGRKCETVVQVFVGLQSTFSAVNMSMPIRCASCSCSPAYILFEHRRGNIAGIVPVISWYTAQPSRHVLYSAIRHAIHHRTPRPSRPIAENYPIASKFAFVTSAHDFNCRTDL